MSNESGITRRDFLNGTLLTVGSAMLPPLSLAETEKIASSSYPPLLTGMRGSTDDSFSAAHALAMGGKKNWGRPQIDDRTEYDLVVVGGGISGLAAAYFYKQKHGSDKRILILDNHDDFGGHARRNEFQVNGKTHLCYGGSQAMEEPSEYSKVTKKLLADLNVNLKKFDTAYDFNFSKKHNLRSATYFNKAVYGQDKNVAYMFSENGESIEGSLGSLLTPRQAVEQMPISKHAKIQLFRVLQNDESNLKNKSLLKKFSYAKNTLYFDALKKHLGVDDPQVLQILRSMVAPDYGVGADILTIPEAIGSGLPGIPIDSLDFLVKKYLQQEMGEGEESEPYIHHFPDGNASIARLLVQSLIPRVARISKNNAMEDVVMAKFDYSQLDNTKSPVRLRLNSTAIHIGHIGKGKNQKVQITYSQNGKPKQILANNCVMACYNMMIPHVIPSLPDKQKYALKQQVKIPLVYTTVMLKNWRALKKLGIDSAYCPGSMHSYVSCDFPINFKQYKAITTPDKPMALTMFYTPLSTKYGTPPKDQFREGRYKLLATPFATFEEEVKTHLNGMLGKGGFNAERDISAITVNRWSHGYAYPGTTIYDTKMEKYAKIGRARFGKITIANSDSEPRAYMDAAIDQAHRAVKELRTATR